MRLGKNQGEFLVLGIMLASFHGLYASYATRVAGFEAKLFDTSRFEGFPRSVVPEERRRRTYVNAVLARAEEGSAYRPARRLWKRERQGHYVPSATTRLRTIDDAGTERFVPLRELLRIDWLDELCRTSP